MAPIPRLRNPYDRRRDPREQDGNFSLLRDGTVPIWESPRPGLAAMPDPGLAIEDLEALARSARERGRQEAEARHLEDLDQARRSAWDEGCVVGIASGREELLARIDLQHGLEVRDLFRGCKGLVAELRAEPRRVTKADLEKALEKTMTILEGLIQAHHNGFPVADTNQTEEIRG